MENKTDKPEKTLQTTTPQSLSSLDQSSQPPPPPSTKTPPLILAIQSEPIDSVSNTSELPHDDSQNHQENVNTIDDMSINKNNETTKTSLISTSTTTTNHQSNANFTENNLTITAMVASIAEDNKKQLIANQTNNMKSSSLKTSDIASTTSDKENEMQENNSINAQQQQKSNMTTSSPILASVGTNKKLLNDNTSMIINNDTLAPQIPMDHVISKQHSSSEQQTMPNNQPQLPKVKKPKLIKPKTKSPNEKQPNMQTEIKLEKKPAIPKVIQNGNGNVAKKRRISIPKNQQSNQPLDLKMKPGDTTSENKNLQIKPQYHQISSVPNNFQLMPMQLMNHLISKNQESAYPWKPYDYTNQGFNTNQSQPTLNTSTPSNADYNKPLPSINAFLSNAKYSLSMLDLLHQTKNQQNYQPFFSNLHQNPYANHQLQQQSAVAAMAAQFQQNFTGGFNQSQFNTMQYMQEEAFKKPVMTNGYQSLINHDYNKPMSDPFQAGLFANQMGCANGLANRSFTEKNLSINDSTSMDSLKETQMKISESCSLVNESS